MKKINIYELAGSIGSVLRKVVLVTTGSIIGCTLAIKFAKKGGWL